MNEPEDDNGIDCSEDDDPGMRPSELSFDELMKKWEKEKRQGTARYQERKLGRLSATGSQNHSSVVYGKAQRLPAIRGVSEKQCNWAEAIREKHHKFLRSKAKRAFDAGDTPLVAEIKSQWEACRDTVEAKWWIDTKDFLPGADRQSDELHDF